MTAVSREESKLRRKVDSEPSLQNAGTNKFVLLISNTGQLRTCGLDVRQDSNRSEELTKWSGSVSMHLWILLRLGWNGCANWV